MELNGENSDVTPTEAASDVGEFEFIAGGLISAGEEISLEVAGLEIPSS